MARLVIDNDTLIVSMSRMERMAALHVDVKVPLSSVERAEAVPDVLAEVRGYRAPGTGIPGSILYGICRGSFGRDFWAAKGHGPGVVVSLSEGPYVRLIVSATSSDDANAQAGAIEAAMPSSEV